MTSNYFKDKQPTRVFGNEKHDQTQEKFTDKYFPPTLQTLLGKKPDGTYYKDASEIPKEDRVSFENIVFKRVSEFMESPLLFEDKIDLNDVEQGKLGDCYFLASIASLCKYPRMIYELFQTKTLSKNGFYELTLFVNGEWQTVVIDDYIPFDTSVNMSAFVKPKNGEIWLLLLEKAWAKVNGSYYGISGGRTNQGFLTLTGFPSKKVSLDPKNKDALFEEIKKGVAKGALVGTGSNSNIDEKEGICAGHAYSITDAFVITNKSGHKKKVVHLRNPHGKNEWTGAWIKSGFVPDDASVSKVDVRKKGLGNFYMPYSEFIKYFSDAFICYFQPGARIKSHHLTKEYSNQPIIFNVRMEEAGRLTVQSIAKQAEISRNSAPNYAQIVISRIDKYNKIVSFSANKLTEHTNYHSVKLEKGVYIVWVCANYSKLTENDLGSCVKFSSDKNFYAEYICKDPLLNCLKCLVLPEVKKQMTSSFIGSKTINSFEGSLIGVWYAKASNSSDYGFYQMKPTGYRIHQINDVTLGSIKVNAGEEAIGVGLIDKEATSIGFSVVGDSYTVTQATSFNPQPHPATWVSSVWFNKNLGHSTLDYFDVVVRSKQDLYLKNEFPKNDPVEVFFLKLSKKNAVISNLLSEYKPFAVKGNKFEVQANFCGQQNAENQIEGIGAYIFSADTYKLGQWENNKLNGQGKYYSKSKLYYKGEFKNDQFEGDGMLYSDGQLLIKGKFANGKAEGRGNYYFPDGGVWEGMFVAGNTKGMGRYTDKNGNVTETALQ